MQKFSQVNIQEKLEKLLENNESSENTAFNQLGSRQTFERIIDQFQNSEKGRPIEEDNKSYDSKDQDAFKDKNQKEKMPKRRLKDEPLQLKEENLDDQPDPQQLLSHPQSPITNAQLNRNPTNMASFNFSGGMSVSAYMQSKKRMDKAQKGPGISMLKQSKLHQEPKVVEPKVIENPLGPKITVNNIRSDVPFISSASAVSPVASPKTSKFKQNNKINENKGDAAEPQSHQSLNAIRRLKESSAKGPTIITKESAANIQQLTQSKAEKHANALANKNRAVAVKGAGVDTMESKVSSILQIKQSGGDNGGNQRSVTYEDEVVDKPKGSDRAEGQIKDKKLNVIFVNNKQSLMGGDMQLSPKPVTKKSSVSKLLPAGAADKQKGAKVISRPQPLKAIHFEQYQYKSEIYSPHFQRNQDIQKEQKASQNLGKGKASSGQTPPNDMVIFTEYGGVATSPTASQHQGISITNEQSKSMGGGRKLVSRTDKAQVNFFQNNAPQIKVHTSSKRIREPQKRTQAAILNQIVGKRAAQARQAYADSCSQSNQQFQRPDEPPQFNVDTSIFSGEIQAHRNAENATTQSAANKKPIHENVEFGQSTGGIFRRNLNNLTRSSIGGPNSRQPARFTQQGALIPANSSVHISGPNLHHVTSGVDDMMAESHQNFIFDKAQSRRDNGFPLRPQSSKLTATKGVHMLGRRNTGMEYGAPHRLSMKSMTTLNKPDADEGAGMAVEVNPLSTDYDGAPKSSGGIARMSHKQISIRVAFQEGQEPQTQNYISFGQKSTHTINSKQPQADASNYPRSRIAQRSSHNQQSRASLGTRQGRKRLTIRDLQ